MYNQNYKIFFSYTIRDGLINKDNLNIFKNNLNKIGLFNTYIDLIDNNYIENPQLKVFEELELASVVCVIDTPCINKSPWVSKEIRLAKQLFKPILIISFNDFISFCKCPDTNSLYSCYLTSFIINFTLRN